VGGGGGATDEEDADEEEGADEGEDGVWVRDDDVLWEKRAVASGKEAKAEPETKGVVKDGYKDGNLLEEVKRAGAKG
jgi:hypothetical protein